MFRWTRHALLAGALGALLGANGMTVAADTNKDSATPEAASTQGKAGPATDAGSQRIIARAATAGAKYDVGRPATPAEVKAWDIDVRPDFKGLPRGSGTVDQGMDIWDASCASCHGSFGESNSVFTPLVGGTTPKDIETGNVAALTGNGQPARTTFMKVSTVSTLWDYIHRAMPWDKPKSLKPDEVYAVLAYLLNLAEIVPSDFTLSDENIAQVQDKMPNRHGMKFWEGLWKVDGRADTANVACMSDCTAADKPSSALPPHARDAHGDLAAQMRVVGPVRGVNTHAGPLSGSAEDNASKVREHARGTVAAVQAPGAKSTAAGSGEGISAKEDGAGKDSGAAASTGGSAEAVAGAAAGQQAMAMMSDSGCMACHARDKKVLGPSFLDIAAKYKGQDDAVARLADKVRKGGSGAWGAIPMPPHPTLSEADAKAMVEGILAAAAP